MVDNTKSKSEQKREDVQTAEQRRREEGPDGNLNEGQNAPDNSAPEEFTMGEPPRDELGQRTDVPVAPESVPNVPNPSNDPAHPSQPSGSYVPNNPANFSTPIRDESVDARAELSDEEREDAVAKKVNRDQK